MSDPLYFADPEAPSIPFHAVPQDGLEAWCSNQPGPVAVRVKRLGFTGALGQTHLIEAEGAEVAVTGYGTPDSRARGRFHLAAAAATLPPGTYHLVTDLPPSERDEAALGWLLAGYKFDRYKAASTSQVRMVAPPGCDAPRLTAIANGEALIRDLINTPSNDMGPPELETAVQGLAKLHGASVSVTMGEALLAENLPLIHAVGRAADSTRAPRLLDLRHGSEGPLLTLVGKGVCFDTGGLNLKPGVSMGLMKKDMGGAANVLGLASMILSTGLPVRLRVLIPAVENAVSGSAFRPGDILTARNGMTVEINNTDAEGRLVLADALSLACEEDPDILISMATLTGAARVAVGPDLAPFFTGDERLSQCLSDSAEAVADPVWRLPFHTPYESMIEPTIADLDNAPKGGFAGAITAALFLRRFAAKARSYTHFDVYGWQPNAAPARPVGGAGQGVRALLEALPRRFGQ